MSARVLLLVLLCLLAGVLVNTAVAWGLSAWGAPGPMSATFPGGLTMTRTNGAPTFTYTSLSWEASGFGWISKTTDAETPPSSGVFTLTVSWKAGWPLHSLGARHHATSTTPSLSTPANMPKIPSGMAAGLRIGSGGQTERRLPFIPLWPGFAVNSLLYALPPIACVLWWDFRRRRRERLAGCCRRCGYPIGVSPVCTECGAPVDPGPPRMMTQADQPAECAPPPPS